MGFLSSGEASPVRRFEKSMSIDYVKWRDGVGYDLDAIKLASPDERKAIEELLTRHIPRDWRDIEALAVVGSKSALKTIKDAMNDPNPEVRSAVSRFAPNLVDDTVRSESVVDALQHAEVFSGLSQILDDVEDFHPEEVKEALIAGLLSREGDVAVLFAGMLFFLCGKAKEPFDWEQRPFFLRFNTENKVDRVKVFRELCTALNIDPEKYLAQNE